MRVFGIVFVTAIVVGGIALVFIYAGAYNVAATEPHGPTARWLLETVMEKSVKARARNIHPVPLDDAALVAKGGKTYGAMCQSCHGGPGVTLSALARGLRPAAPDLARTARDWQPNELFWIVKNGIKMTGMPAWGPSHSDTELWAVVAFVTRLPTMPLSDYQAYTSGGNAGPMTSDATDDAEPDADVVKTEPNGHATDVATTEPNGRAVDVANTEPGDTVAKTGPDATADRRDAASAAGTSKAVQTVPRVRVQARPQPKPEVPRPLQRRRR